MPPGSDPFSGILAFVHAAEARGLTAAARRLALTPSAVSKAISRLEANIGVRLLNRSSRVVSLTPEGALFYERCRQIVDDMDAARAALAQAREVPHGLLRISLPISFGRLEVMPLLPRLLERHPGLRIEASLANRAVDMTDEGLDAVIRTGPIRDEALVARPLRVIRYLTAASPGYLTRHGTPRTPGGLVGHQSVGLLLSSTGSQADWLFGPDTPPQKMVMASRLVVDSADAMVEAAVAGAGIVQAFDFILHERLARGQLVPILESHASAGPTVWIAWPRRRLLPPKLRVFVDFMVEQMGDPTSPRLA